MPNLDPNDRYVPFTPAGSCLMDIAAPTEEKAWANLMKAAAHMPYKTKENFIKRGYTVEDSETWVAAPQKGATSEDRATEEIGQGVRRPTGTDRQAGRTQQGPADAHGRRRRAQGRR